MSANTGHAAGLGSIDVQSGFGQPLRAVIQLFGVDASDQNSQCLRAKLESLDGSTVISPRINLMRSAEFTSLRLTTHQNINELAMNVSVSIGCESSVRRSYQILLDPVEMLPTVAATSVTSLRTEPATPSPSSLMPFATDDALVSPQKNPSVTRKNKTTHQYASGNESRIRLKSESTLSHQQSSAKSSRSVLKMSNFDDLPLESTGAPPELKISDTLSNSNISSDPHAVAELRAAQVRFAALLRNEDPEQIVQAQLKVAQQKIAALRTETDQIKHLRRSDQAALKSLQENTNGWIKGLQVLLGLCVAAIAWLLWRFYAVKKDSASTPWRELLRGRDGIDTTTLPELEENSEFNTSTLGSFSTTQFVNSEWDTLAMEQPADLRQKNDFRQTAITEINRTIRGAPLKKEAEPTDSLPEKTTRSPSTVDTPPPFLRRHSPPEDALKMEEISDVMELAEAWMALHDPVKVLDILEPFNHVEQPESPLPWLCLLDVYRALGDREKYEAILARITKIYNVRLAPWDPETDDEDEPRTLAQFPHILDTALSLWEGDEVVPYLENLIIDNRDGTRTGFNLPVYRDIIKLLNMANAPTERQSREAVAREFSCATYQAPKKEFTLAAMTPTAAATVEISKNKPVLRERPKYITTAYQHTVTHRDNLAKNIEEHETPSVVSAQKPSPRLHEVSHHEAVASSEPIKQPDYDAMSPMAIKLHLAIAYQDIGDKEGASLLLEEVIQEGTPEQIEQAKILRAKLV